MYIIKPIHSRNLYFYKHEWVAIIIVLFVVSVLIPSSYVSYVEGRLDSAFVAVFLAFFMPLWIYQLIIKNAFIRREFRSKVEHYEIDVPKKIVKEYVAGEVYRSYFYGDKKIEINYCCKNASDIIIRGGIMHFLEGANAKMFQRPEFEKNSSLFIMYQVPNAELVLEAIK